MPTSRRIIDSSGDDFYPTPEWATRTLLVCEEFTDLIWEPACGDGAMSRILEEDHSVVSSDSINRGYGRQANFLAQSDFTAANIVTNPPYNFAEEFVKKGLELSTHKLALLLRLSFLESARRFESIFSRSPPTRIWVFSERITFYPNGNQTAGSGTLAYAWFVWEKPLSGTSELKWIPPKFKSDSRHENHNFTNEELEL